MIRTQTVLVSVVALLLVGCNPITEWEQNPGLVRSKAELAGGATVFTYFAINTEAKAGAVHLREVVKVVAGIVDSFPSEGFAVFLPDVNKALETMMTGAAAEYLLPAKLLASVMLESLQHKADKDHWFDDKNAVADILSAYLSGVDAALVAYVKPDA